MTRFQQSLKVRLIALAIIVLVGIIAVIHSAVYVTTRNFIENELGAYIEREMGTLIEDEVTMSAQGIATAVAHHIMSDIEAYKGFLGFVDEYKTIKCVGALGKLDEEDYMPREYYENNPYYRRLQDYFSRIMEFSHVRHIYTVRKLDDGSDEFILVGEPIGSASHYSPGTIDEIDPNREIAFATGEPRRFWLEDYGEGGAILGAYAPIFDDNGDLLGIVGVDVCGTHLQNNLRKMYGYLERMHGHVHRMQLILVSIYVAVIGSVLLVLMRFSGVILEPLLKDKLTGAYNKRFAEKLIQDEIRTAVKEQGDLALMVLDLDHFKSINDTYGHNFGDKVLASVSQTIQSVLRRKDYFIRYGGEEFIALFPKANEKRAMEIAERIRHTVEESEIFNEEKDIFIKMTISIGVATLKDTAPSARGFIEHADKALYIAKQDRNTVSLYTQETEMITAEKQEEYMKSSALASGERRRHDK